MNYFVVMIDYGRRGREAIVDPEMTRRDVVACIKSGEYKNIAFIHHVCICWDGSTGVEDVTQELLCEANDVLPPSNIRPVSVRGLVSSDH